MATETRIEGFSVDKMDPASGSSLVEKQPIPPVGLAENSFAQYCAAFATSVVLLLFSPGLERLIGYEAVALVDLLAVVVLALFVERGPIILGTTLTALGWGFLAPPRFTFHIGSFYDKMMFCTYFVVALTIGQLMARLRAQQDAALKAKLLVESERLSRTLLNSVSHEFRTPIAAITAAATELRSAGALNATQQNLASEIEAASDRLNRVVKGLLSAARLQSGQIRPKMDWCDVSELVRMTLKELAQITEGRSIEVRIAAGLPLVKMDFVLVGQALGNLITNAVMHTSPGTPIRITASAAEGELRLEVADSGTGLPDAELQRVFDLFHRAPNAKPGGIGLGLPIVRGFIEAHGGSVIAANRPEGGAVFTIALPARDVPKLPLLPEESE